MAKLITKSRAAAFVLSAAICTLPLVGETSNDAAIRPLLLTSAKAVHELPAELAQQARVQIMGVVSFYDPRERNLFIQDKSGAVYIETDKAYPIRYGDLVSIRGLAVASYRTEVAPDPEIQVLERGHHVVAQPAEYGKLATGELDCRMVKISGRVRAVNIEKHESSSILHLDVALHGGEIEVYQPLPFPESDPASSGDWQGLSFLDSIVEIEGVAGGAFDSKSQMTGVIVYAQKPSSIHIVKQSHGNALKLPLSDIDTVLASRHVEDRSARIRVRGTLTFYKKGESAVLEEGGKSIFVETRETMDIPVGNVVDAVGFASDREYAPSLHEALLFDTHIHSEVKPISVGYSDALSGNHSDNLVSIKGLLVSQLRNGNTETLVINANGNFVTGRLENAPLQNFRVGTKLRITGICRMVGSSSWQVPSAFHIEMRSASDIVVLSPTSWWSVQHLAELLGTLSAVVLAISTWVVLLRRRVRQQTESLELAMLIARTRSTLLETLCVRKTARALLQDFSEQVSILLPRFACSFHFGGEGIGQSIAASPGTPRILIHATPLRETGGDIVGHLAIFGMEPAAPGSRQPDICLMLSEVATQVLQQSLLYQDLIYHSTHDPLTDLPNGRLCDERLRKALEEAASAKSRVTVVYIDVDRFKEVNDHYGHQTGDWYLRLLSARLRSAVRSVDTLARVGGDEFMIIVPHNHADVDLMALEKRLSECFVHPFEIEGKSFTGSASFGMASFPEHGVTPKELQQHADQAMYVAKRRSSSSSRHSRRSPQFAILTHTS